MRIVQPLIAAAAVFSIFSYVLSVRAQAHLFGEIGFVYLALAMAYTILPGVMILALDFYFPLMVDGQNFVDLAPSPVELGTHFWRHVLFISGVAAGYLFVRGGAVKSAAAEQRPAGESGPLITMWLVIIGLSMIAIALLSAPVTTYLENYTRFDHLGWIPRRLVYVCLILKSGGYFVLLALMFNEYRRYRTLILIVVPIIGIYESVNSFGSRIETLTILLAVIGFFHFRVAPVSLKKGVMYLSALAVLFTGIGLFRASGYDLRDAQAAITQEGGQQLAEFGAVYNTSFHLYSERAQRTLPPRPWEMFFYEVIAVIPFLDHTTNHPQYWYARNYFPQAVVPPQTMGVIADSALWGGELDLLVRSLLNGALFAYLTRWFLRRRENWIAINIYVFCVATCVMTLKYSVLYQAVPIVQTLIPTLVITALMSRLFRPRDRGATAPAQSMS